MLITRGFGVNTGGGTSVDRIYVNVPNPEVVTNFINASSFSTEEIDPVLNIISYEAQPSINETKEYKTNISSANLLKPYLKITEE